MTLPIRAKVIFHERSYGFYHTQRRHMIKVNINNSKPTSFNFSLLRTHSNRNETGTTNSITMVQLAQDVSIMSVNIKYVIYAALQNLPVLKKMKLLGIKKATLIQYVRNPGRVISFLRWPKWLTFHFHTTSQFRIPNSEFRIPNSEICTTNFGIRNCEVYIIWASGNR